MDGCTARFKGSQERKRVPVQAALGGRSKRVRLKLRHPTHGSGAGNRLAVKAAPCAAPV